MKLLPNGNLQFEKGERIPLLTMYRPANEEGSEFEPKFDEPCEVRAFQGKQCPLNNRVRFQWWCILRMFYTTIKDCRECNVPKTERNIQTAASRGLIGDCNCGNKLRSEDADLLGTESKH